LAERVKPTVALCMGEFGLLSRVLAPKFGGLFTFAALERGAESAIRLVSLMPLAGRLPHCPEDPSRPRSLGQARIFTVLK
ncbi:MAG: type I 3-dehydroquinate dehydratase, partial [Candidatus Hydrogenedentes bacterium]|nr:type I 3-dehydroquinate dehydratase [Candidatus Hydrogenedentota bacterium]